MGTSVWPIKRLKVLVKGQQGQGGGGGSITNAEIEDILDKMSDDHQPGNEAGEEAPIPDDAKDDGGKAGGEIDENGKAIDEQIKEGAENGQKEGAQKPQAAPPSPTNTKGGKGGPGAYFDQNAKVDYNKIKPKFNWKQLIQRFIMSHKPKPEETYAKPSRKSVSGMHIAGQMGAAAIKPGEKPLDEVDVKLGFVIDSSGSMSSVIGTVMANAIQLLKNPIFKKCVVTVIKYSGHNSIHKVKVATNQAAEVKDVDEKPKLWPLKAQEAVFGKHIGAGTNFDQALTNQIQKMLDKGYNVVMFPDSDILAGANLVNFVKVFQKNASQVFVVFDCRNSYIQFRQTVGLSTANVTYFQ
jgi:hypothetical protein